MNQINPDYLLSSYDYHLPEERIAQEPAPGRDASRLMLLDRSSGKPALKNFKELPDLLPPNALLVANNSRVLPARLYGAKPTGGRVEFLLLTPLPILNVQNSEGSGWFKAKAQGLIRSSKGPKPGGKVIFSDDFHLTVIEPLEFGRCKVELHWRGVLPELFVKLGHQPLPPYIKRPDTPDDAVRYQTVYSDVSKTGSVAAPTAGLHFTPELRSRLADKGFGWTSVTLYVGYGTFSPVREDDIRRHEMHAEYVEISRETADAVAKAKADGRPVVAVGTTSVRALEGAYLANNGPGPFKGWIDMFIYPGFHFNVTDHMLTNFHLPKSSLLMMISAFADRNTVLAAYDRAVKEGFRFFSYGDAMLIL